MDKYPKRFGWRLWHLDATTRLLSPYHKGTPVRGGGRIVESVCSHRQDALELSHICDCGVYFDSNPAEAVERWRWGTDDFGAERMAMTFGVAVGDAAPDPILPDTAMRAARYAILAIVVMPGSSIAGELRSRYGVNVTMSEVTEATLQGVHDVIRTDLRNTPSAQFLDDLRAEPLLPDGGHVMDQLPQLFGWSVWHLDKYGGDIGLLSNPIAAARSIEHNRTSKGAVWFEAKCFHTADDPTCMCGISYTPSGFYCTHVLANLMVEHPSWTFAATFGIANGHIVKNADPFADLRRCQRNFPMTICIPATHQRLQVAMQKRYGMAVIPALHPQTFAAVERMARARLASVCPEDLS
ncbi:hypothetical protein EV580_3155 [Mycobacterium sp. BK086]|nr:hypothetical protein EV580_3155 [Mycobacterium sp. BK086]